jgi:adenylate cyclase
MARSNLKNILSAKGESYGLVNSFIQELNAVLFIEDSSGKILIGTGTEPVLFEKAIELDGEVIAWIRGDHHVSLIASLLQLLVQKDAERKKLGSEVLMLYQEVNMIFNFSEKLAHTIGQASIAETTLDETARLIKSDSGLLFLWENAESGSGEPASIGEPLLRIEKFRADNPLLTHISGSGQSDIISELSALKASGAVADEVQSLMYAALKVQDRILGAIILARKEALQYSAADLKFLVTVAQQASSAIESAILYEKNIRESKEREEAMRRIYEVTNRFVPHEFIRSLGRTVITDIQLGDQVEKIVTVLFSDIREYTSLAEKMTPEENFRFVCSFNERIGPIIREHHGFINQYLGDAIMAIFPGRASDALAAAVEMHEAVALMNESRMRLNQPPIKIGVGMHTGPLIMGITGDLERLDATTIADTVNTASRLEGLTKYFKVNILLSEASIQNLASPDAFHLRHLGPVQLKGKMEAIDVYECFNGGSAEELDKKLTALPVFRQGVSAYFNKSFDHATRHFAEALNIYPEDVTAKMFLERSHQYVNRGIPENWTGVEAMVSK